MWFADNSDDKDAILIICLRKHLNADVKKYDALSQSRFNGTREPEAKRRLFQLSQFQGGLELSEVPIITEVKAPSFLFISKRCSNPASHGPILETEL